MSNDIGSRSSVHLKFRCRRRPSGKRVRSVAADVFGRAAAEAGRSGKSAAAVFASAGVLFGSACSRRRPGADARRWMVPRFTIDFELAVTATAGLVERVRNVTGHVVFRLLLLLGFRCGSPRVGGGENYFLPRLLLFLPQRPHSLFLLRDDRFFNPLPGFLPQGARSLLGRDRFELVFLILFLVGERDCYLFVCCCPFGGTPSSHVF